MARAEHDRDQALKRATEYADKAMLLAPDDAEAHRIRAEIHTKAGEIEQAPARFDQAIALNPSNSDILVGSTNPLLFVGRTDEAIDRIAQAKGIDPFHPDWFHWQMVGLGKRTIVGGLRWRRCKMPESRAAPPKRAGIHACLETTGSEGSARVSSKTSPCQSSARTPRGGGRWTAPEPRRWSNHAVRGLAGVTAQRMRRRASTS